MKKIALTAATLLALSGAALAESPTDAGPSINAIAAQQQIDNTQTSSVRQGLAGYELPQSGQTIAEQNKYAVRNGQRDFGNN